MHTYVYTHTHTHIIILLIVSTPRVAVPPHQIYAEHQHRTQMHSEEAHHIPEDRTPLHIPRTYILHLTDMHRRV